MTGCRLHAVPATDIDANWRLVEEHRLAVSMCECCLGPATLPDDAPATVFLDGYRLVLDARCRRCRVATEAVA